MSPGSQLRSPEKNKFIHGLVTKINQAESEINAKQGQRDAFTNELENIKVQWLNREKEIKDVLHETEEILAVLKRKKQKEWETSLIELDRLSLYIKQQNEQIAALQEEKKTLEGQVKNAHLNVENRHNKELDSIK